MYYKKQKKELPSEIIEANIAKNCWRSKRNWLMG